MQSAFSYFFSRTDYVLAALIFVTMFSLLLSFKAVRIDEFYGDTAMYFQSIENIASRGVPVSQAKEGIDDYSFGAEPVSKIAKDPHGIFGTPTPVLERSVLLGHAYLILYPIALLVKLFPVKIVLLSIYVLSFTFLIRSKEVSAGAAGLFCLLVLSQPTWSEGLLWGQFYPDRIFIGAGFIFMSLASIDDNQRIAKVPNRFWLLALGILCASLNERGALTSGIFLLAYSALYWGRPGFNRYYRLILGVGLFAYGYIVMKFFLPSDVAYHSFMPTTPSGLLSLIEDPHFASGILLFLLVNAPLFVIACFQWRAAAIAALLMAPNIIGNIGGAEKTGWSTHYMSYFFPALVWAALMGYSALYRLASVRRVLPGVYAGIGALILSLGTLNPYLFPLNIKIANLENTFLPMFNSQADVYLLSTVARNNLERAAEGIRRAVPRGAVVSSVEGGMTPLYQDHLIEFYPADIDNADYAVLDSQLINGKLSYYGAISYLGSVEQAKLNDLALARMKSDGYDLDHPQLFPALGLAVVKRGR